MAAISFKRSVRKNVEQSSTIKLFVLNRKSKKETMDSKGLVI